MQHLVRVGLRFIILICPGPVAVRVRFQKFFLVQSLTSKFSSNRRVAGVQRLDWPTLIQDVSALMVEHQRILSRDSEFQQIFEFRFSCFIIFQYGMLWTISYGPYHIRHIVWLFSLWLNHHFFWFWFF